MKGYETKEDRVAKDDWLPRGNTGLLVRCCSVVVVLVTLFPLACNADLS